MKRLFVYALITFAACIYACSGPNAEERAADKMAVMEAAAPMASEASTLAEPELMDVAAKGNSAPPPPLKSGSRSQKSIEKKIIKDGELSITVKDIDETRGKIAALVKKTGAYYESDRVMNDDENIHHMLKIRVPAAKFEALVEALEKGDDEITYKNIEARDVTEEFIDLESRLGNKREYLKRYRELLTKADKVKDIIEIEEKIRELLEEIESAEGRLKYLNDQVSFSTLTINLNKEKPYVFRPAARYKFSERVKSALSRGWDGVVDLFLGIINIWPLLLAGSVAFVVVRSVIRKRRKENQ